MVTHFWGKSRRGRCARHTRRSSETRKWTGWARWVASPLVPPRRAASGRGLGMCPKAVHLSSPFPWEGGGRGGWGPPSQGVRDSGIASRLARRLIGARLPGEHSWLGCPGGQEAAEIVKDDARPHSQGQVGGEEAGSSNGQGYGRLVGSPDIPGQEAVL